MRQFLIAAEIGLSVVLLATAGLFIRSYLKLLLVNQAFVRHFLAGRLAGSSAVGHHVPASAAIHFW